MKDISTELDWADMDNWDISAVENPDEIAAQRLPENSEASPDWSVNIGRAAAQIIKKETARLSGRIESPRTNLPDYARFCHAGAHGIDLLPRVSAC